MESNYKEIEVNEIKFQILVPTWDVYIELFQDKGFTEGKDEEEINEEDVKSKVKYLIQKWVKPMITDEMFKSVKWTGFILALSIELPKPLEEMMVIKKKLTQLLV